MFSITKTCKAKITVTKLGFNRRKGGYQDKNWGKKKNGQMKMKEKQMKVQTHQE